VGEKRQNGECNGGVLTRIKALLERNRLGELLVLKGLLTPGDLHRALDFQKSGSMPLGTILVRQNMVSRHALRRTLLQQATLRGLTAFIGIFLTFASFGIKSARAGSIKDIPAQISLVSAAAPAFSVPGHHPALFGTEERASANLEPFTKLTGMFERFDGAMARSGSQQAVTAWKSEIVAYKGLPLEQMADRVNGYINGQKYIIDNRNWGQSDYWATPLEFFQRGGDCEDFAIAKYASLRALGVPEERLRIAIVHDLQKDIPHAVLVVYADSGALILDNQNDRVEKASHVTRYRPIFTINRQAWWLHTKPETVLASAR